MIAVIKESSLKVEMENDSPAFRMNILPMIEHDVNQSVQFIPLRQLYSSFILATWFKRKLKDSIYKYYIDMNKTKGIDTIAPKIKEYIYNQYLEAFKKGAYNYIKKETVGTAVVGTRKVVARKYFSGGLRLNGGAVTTVAESETRVEQAVMPDAGVNAVVVMPRHRKTVPYNAQRVGGRAKYVLNLGQNIQRHMERSNQQRGNVLPQEDIHFYADCVARMFVSRKPRADDVRLRKMCEAGLISDAEQEQLVTTPTAI